MNPRKSFRETYAFPQRASEAKRIRKNYPDRIPVVVERDSRSAVPEIDKHKYLVPRDLTIGQFMYVIRKRIKLAPEQALFFFTDQNRLPPTACLISKVYQDEKDPDEFLYLTYASENTFGSTSPRVYPHHSLSVRDRFPSLAPANTLGFSTATDLQTPGEQNAYYW